MFRTERITEAIWPEAAGIGLYLGGQILAASIDTAQREAGTYQFPVAQNIVTFGSIAGGMAMVGYDRHPGIGKGLMYGAGIGLIAQAIRAIYEGAQKVEGRVRLSDCAALIPRRVGAVRRPAGGGGGAALKLDTGRTLRFDAARALGTAKALGAGAVINNLPREVLPTVESRRGM